jgi:hypothetical protein
MKAIYYVEITDPQSVGILPPHVVYSSWGQNVLELLQKHSLTHMVNPERIQYAIFFESVEQLDAVMREMELKDAELVDDIVLWQVANGIEVSENFWYITEPVADAPRVAWPQPTPQRAAEIRARRAAA